MNRNLQSSSQLTEFAPLSPEPSQPGVGFILSKFFRFNNKAEAEIPNPAPAAGVTPDLPVKTEWPPAEKLEERAAVSDDLVSQFSVDVGEGRSLPNVLKRISNLLALKRTGLQAYEDTDFKQYWMPDSVSKECYDCGEKFTTFRRRHHCRVCGQIFCSRCCNQEIPGKIMGCTGDLRVCTYCCKVVLSYLKSADIGADLSSDLRALQEDLQIKFGNIASSLSHSVRGNLAQVQEAAGRRKVSVEDKCTHARAQEETSPSLRAVYDDLMRPGTGLSLQTHRQRLRHQQNCFLGSELLEWLLLQNHAPTRSHAVALVEDLVEAGYLESTGEQTFLDGYSLYRPCRALSPQEYSSPSTPSDENGRISQEAQEPLWVKQIPPQDSAPTTDSESDCQASERDDTLSLPSSSSMFYLDLNVAESTVHLSKPVNTRHSTPDAKPNPGKGKLEESSQVHGISSEFLSGTLLLQNAQSRELVPASGWHKVAQLRTDNGELQAFTLLSNAFRQHEQNLLKQLLNAEGLSQSWLDVVIPLAQQIVDIVRPNVRTNMDIRQYVQFKKVAGGSRNESCIVNGVVCTKNVAHRSMATELTSPRILLLRCSIVYQRIEGRLLSLEPVMMQEREYLRHVVARIANLRPDIVLVERNVSRLAQELLLALKMTLVLNVKASVLERVKRCTRAEIVTSVDAHIEPPQLGSCKSFYLRTFHNDKGVPKTLMFFENDPSQHLGCSVLLRGAGVSELARLKRVISRLVSAEYSWRLEKSFLMDEFARPPSPPTDSFFEEPAQDEVWSAPERGKQAGDNRAVEKMRISSKDKSLSEEKRMNVESVSDFSDPLHQYQNLEDEVFNASNGSGQCLSVAELPLSNRFRKALDDSILSSSPYLKFSVPYLETETGRNCALRKFFPQEIFWSAQFDTTSTVRGISNSEASEALLQDGDSKFKDMKMKPQHPFVSAKLTTAVDNRDVQSMVAHFRACGGRVDPGLGKVQARSTMPVVESAPAVRHGFWADALDYSNHQRLAVLFCSYSHESSNAPAFCENPRVEYMHFYGPNDKPLGRFLEEHCFCSSYKCPSLPCHTPVDLHVRRYVHDVGCVHIILKELDKQIPDTDGSGIVMWSWCSKCKMVSPVVPMSADTWALSFAKYLELRFHGGMYRRRGLEGTYCLHSLHHEQYQYFALRNMVASFKYTNITLWEVSLPPPLIATYYDPQQQANVIEEIKLLALKGYEVYSSVLEKLCALAAELEGVAVLKQQLQKEQVHFKSCIEEIQLKLTSPTLEAKKLEGRVAEKDVQLLMWRIEDSVVHLKRLISDVNVNWNSKIQDLLLGSKRRDEKTRRSESGKPLPPATSHSLEYDRVSSSSSQHPDDLAASQWDDTSSCSEGREDMSPSSPEPPAVVGAAMELGDTDSSGPAHDMSSDTNVSTGSSQALASSLPSSSPRGHVRSYSDVTPSVGEGQHVDKKSMKTILSHLLSASTMATLIQSPLSPQEHHLASSGCSVPVVVYENEPSSIIAYALSSQEYQRGLDEILAKKNASSEQTVPSPVNKRKSAQPQAEREELLQSSESRRSGVLSFLRGSSTAISVSGGSSRGMLDGVQYSTSPAADVVGSPAAEPDDVSKGSRAQENLHIEVQFSDSSSNFFCRIFFVEQFANLRQMVLPTGEEGFVRSLTRCVQWAARGGKSGSSFCKTRDDRFILKEMSTVEMHLFLKFAPHYFSYVLKCLQSQLPTLLGKIVGVYRIVYRNTTSNDTLRSNLLVMENLFYARSVTHKFDLKGSVRNRLVNPTAADCDGEIVLMDENLLNMTCEDPLYILPHSKDVLTHAIQTDTYFLASQSVMDYSLLVGLDKERKELVVGIIDYIRTFTWDKKLETMVKSSGILGGQGKQPTVVSPNLYRKRFIAAMHRYFLAVPDRWTGLGRDLTVDADCCSPVGD